MIVKHNMDNEKHSLSFFYKLMLSMIAIILLISLVISGVSYGQATQIIKEMQLEVIKKNVEIIESTINSEFLLVEDLILELINLDIIRDTAERQSIPETEYDFIKNNFEYSINKVLNNSNKDKEISIDILNIYLKNGVSYSTLPEQNLNYYDYSSCNTYLTSTGFIENSNYTPATWIETIPIKNSSGNVVQSCFCIRFLYDSVTMEKIGLIVVGVDESGINDIYRNVYPEAYIFQNTGKIISSNNSLMIGTSINTELFKEITKAEQASRRFNL